MKRKKSSGGRWPLVDQLESRAYLTAAFGAPTFVTDVSNITGIATGDLTGKGHSDIVVVGTSSGTSNPVLAIYLGKNGAFSTPTLIPFPGTTGGVAIGDFLANGHQDIAAVDASDNTLSVYLNDGSGNFSQGVGAGLGGTSGDTGVAVGDFNDDGKQDVVVVEPGQDAVQTFLSVGDQFGRFVAGTSVSVPSPTEVVTGDFNNDGYSDLAILSSSNPDSVYIAMNDTHGNFSTPVAYPVGNNIASISSISVSDFNNDHLPDLVAVGTQTGTNVGVAAVLLNQGAGVFGAATPLTVAADPVLVATGAFAGSSNESIASLSATGGLDVLPGDGAGNFGADQQLFTTQLGTPATQVVSADFNGDGNPDIAFVSGGSQGGFGVSLNLAAPTITTHPLITGATSALTPAVLTAVPTSPVVAGVKLRNLRERVSITNSGSTTITGNVTVSLVLSTTTTGISTDPTIATVVLRHVKIKPHQVIKTLPITITSIPAASTGTFYLLALVTDPSNAQSVAASARTFQVVGSEVDLTGAFVRLPKSITPGLPTAVGLKVTNDGTIAAVGPLEFKLYASQTGALDNQAVLVADVHAGHVSIKPGQSLPIHVHKIFKNVKAGNYFLILQVDPSDVFHDANVANNTITSSPPAISVG